MRIEKRRLVLLIVVLFVAAIGLDASRAPGRQITTAIAIRAIHVYQRTVSPVLERQGMRCRFTPTCSRYAEASLRKHGIIGGGWRTVRRIARCGPWTPVGTGDPPE